MTSRKLSNLYLFCLACLTCFTWMSTHKKLLLKSRIYKLTQGKSSQLGLVGWWAKTHHKSMKYMLVWPSNDYEPFSLIAHGQEQFKELKCPVSNCFVTANTSFFRDIRQFDSIAFMGQELNPTFLPTKRAMYQIYIFFSMESSPNYPSEAPIYDGFFNWTATYRLDSEIPLPYILIRDRDGNVVGPKINMHWMPEAPVDDELIPDVTKHKTRAAAIFYSSCRSLSAREELIHELNVELKRFGLAVHVYGSCGPYKCSRRNATRCQELLTREYYFYLSYENSLDFDYVTEKLLTAMQHYVVPIVYGGANYSRFLPPGSFLDASEMTTMKLANTMVELITSPKRYRQYFWWRQYYSYHDPIAKENICNICAALNDKELLNLTKIYTKFRKWWNVNL